MARAPLIADIRRNALDDGPGIRSTVFFKGCPLRCVWCQNPEALSPRAELQHQATACIGCGGCAERCAHGATIFTRGRREHRREACRVCGGCVEVCPAAALRVVGKAYPVQDLVELLLEDEPFYRNSGGGVTFSGGEPTLHLGYVARVAAGLKEHGVHLLLETCGHYEAERFETQLLPLLDAIYFDVKLADATAHQRHTGVDNHRILENLQRLARHSRQRVLPRIPLIPGITDTKENLESLARRLRQLGFDAVSLLPYNPLWSDKCRGLGQEVRYSCDGFMSADEVARCQEIVASSGLVTG